MFKRLRPLARFADKPCLYTAIGTAYKDINNEDFGDVPVNISSNKYSSIQGASEFISEMLPVRKYHHFKLEDHIDLKRFLMLNFEKCIVCVDGYFVYCDGDDYWAFDNKISNRVIAIWYLEHDKKS